MIRLSALLLPALLLPAALCAPGAASACSLAPGYSVPTNLQLAADANAIVVGEVIGADESGIAVRPVTALKGLLPGETIRLGGTQIGTVPPAEELDFSAPHPEAYAGGCIRRTFAANAQVLFFLRRSDAGWLPAGGPFSRWAEDVSGPEDPWLQLATLYAHAAQLDDAQRAALLADQVEALQARGQADGGDRVALAMASDVEHSLAGPAEPLVHELPPPPAPSDAGEAETLEEMPMDQEMQEDPGTVDLGTVQAAIDALDGTR